MLGYDLRDIVFLHHRIKRSFRIYDHDRPERAQAETSGFHYADFLGQPVRRDLFFQSFSDPLAAGRSTSGSAADEYM